MSPSTSFDPVVERELLGICKQSMLQLGQQLRQYVDQLHNQYNKHDVNPVIVKAALEAFGDSSSSCSNTSPLLDDLASEENSRLSQEPSYLTNGNEPNRDDGGNATLGHCMDLTSVTCHAQPLNDMLAFIHQTSKRDALPLKNEPGVQQQSYTSTDGTFHTGNASMYSNGEDVYLNQMNGTPDDCASTASTSALPTPPSVPTTTSSDRTRLWRSLGNAKVADDYTHNQKVKLIEGVRKRPVLWSRHGNREHQKEAWDQLAAEMQVTTEGAMQLWKSLQACNRKCRSRFRQKGTPVSWPYYQSMMFLHKNDSNHPNRLTDTELKASIGKPKRKIRLPNSGVGSTAHYSSANSGLSMVVVSQPDTS